MEKDWASLKSFVDHLGPLPVQAWESFAGIWEKHTYQRKEVITRVDETEDFLYFVIKGVQRVYYSDGDGRESTLVLTYPHSFGGVVDSFLLRNLSRYYYEALSASTLLRTSYIQLKAVCETHPEVDDLIRQATYVTLSGLLERMADLQSLTSTEKMQKLLERSPQILNLVSHRYLANYLGIDPTNFSKLLNSVRF